MTTSICFIIHGKKSQPKKLIPQLKNFFFDSVTVFRVTAYEQHAMKLADAATRDRHTHIICVGGDGSLNEVVNGIMNACEATPGIVPPRLGIIPMGRGNDFARTMRVSRDIASLKSSLDRDQYQTIDLGVARFTNPAGEVASRYFINITDIGMGGLVAQKLSYYPGWPGAWVSFQRAIISTLLSYRPQKIILHSDGQEMEIDIMNLVIANGKYFGNGIGIAPDASPADGSLSVVVIGNVSLFDYLKFTGDLKKARKLNHPEVNYFTSKEIRIYPAGAPLPIDMDGDFIGYSPLSVRVLPSAIKFICMPAGY
jgi:diacylglycerol kinase (ATP)